MKFRSRKKQLASGAPLRQKILLVYIPMVLMVVFALTALLLTQLYGIQRFRDNCTGAACLLSMGWFWTGFSFIGYQHGALMVCVGRHELRHRLLRGISWVIIFGVGIGMFVGGVAVVIKGVILFDEVMVRGEIDKSQPTPGYRK